MYTDRRKIQDAPSAFIGMDKWGYPITSIQKCRIGKLNQDML